MISYIEYVNMPTKVAIALVGIFLVMQIIGELLEFKGKVVPEFVKIRKYFLRRKQEKQQTTETLKQVQTLLNEVNQHYNQDKIEKRNDWMNWVNSRAIVYDEAVSELTELKEALAANNELTLDLYINVNRNRIIDFASKIINENTIVSREEFTRIFKVYNDYESILKKHGRTNGEVDVAYHIIIESYEEHMKNHTFLEDVRGYKS